MVEKWLRYRDEEEDEELAAVEHNPTKTLEMFQAIRHVSIIVPQIMMNLDKLDQKYAGNKHKSDPKYKETFKKDVQQVLKMTQFLNFYLYNHQNVVMVQKFE